MVHINTARAGAIAVLFATLSLPATAADSYTIDAAHTFPSLEFSHMGISVWRGKFNKTTGKVALDRAAKTGSVDITTDIASIDFGHDEMNKHALKPDWLNAEKFPTMTYKGPIKFEGDKPVSVAGELTLRGVTQPVVLRINSFKCMPHPMLKREVCGADAEGELNRADFGMSQYTDNGMGKIKLRVQVEALKDG